MSEQRFVVLLAASALALAACGGGDAGTDQTTFVSSTTTPAATAPGITSTGAPETTTTSLAPETTVAATSASTAAPATPTTTTSIVPAADLLTYFGIDPTALPPGDTGELSIVTALEPEGRESGVVVLRNNTGAAVDGFEVTAVGRDGSGSLVATATTQGGGEPQTVAPGSIAIATLYAGAEALPDVATWEYTVQADTGAKESVKVDEVAVNGNDVTGLVSNPASTEVTGPISILIVCLDSAGVITGYSAAYADSNSLQSGAKSVFRGNVYHGTVCEKFIAGASGYDF